jgi:hypothetical protein
MAEADSKEATPPAEQQNAEEPGSDAEKAEEALDFEITLGTRRDAASEAGSEEGTEPGSEEDGFVTGSCLAGHSWFLCCVSF